ncbi:ATP-dependent bile acid permease [Lactobacillus phage T280]|nr:ATP-dependent bile acid permease [Lactobacillus phage T280]
MSQAIVPILSYNTLEINIYMEGSEKITPKS